MNPEHRTVRDGEGADEVVAGFLDRRDHQYFAGGRLRFEPRARGGDSVTGACGGYDLTRSWHRRGATPRHATSLSSSPTRKSRKRPRRVFPQCGQPLSSQMGKHFIRDGTSRGFSSSLSRGDLPSTSLRTGSAPGGRNPGPAHGIP